MHFFTLFIRFFIIALFDIIAFAVYRYLNNRFAHKDCTKFWERFNITYILVCLSVMFIMIFLPVNKTVEKEIDNTEIDCEVPCEVGDIIVFGIRGGYDVVSANGAKSIELIEKHRTIIKVLENTPNEMEIIIRIKKKQ